jgi:hypothetical protein
MPQHLFNLPILQVVLALVAFLFSASPATACSPVPPDPWFVEVITFDTRQLPIGITVILTSTNSFPGFRLHNTSQIPLIIPPTLPNQPTIKVLANEWFEQRDGRWARITEELGNVTVRHAAQPQLDYPQPQYTNARPANVRVPATQQTEVRLIYGDRPVVLPMTVVYELNPAYRSESYGQYQAGVSGCSLSPIIPLAIFFSIMAVGISVALGRVIIKRKAQLSQPDSQ